MPDTTRLIALYLPQFHPIPENDEWWGPGFTEWTNTAKARPLFRGHYQPHIPADLGFYDLRLPETREHQARMAKAYGIEAFCYYHYWFGGRRILERPFQEVLSSGKPDFPFCLCWANETWTGVWHGAPNRVLIEQTYPGLEDHKAHFRTLLEAFKDERYIKVGGKPLFLIYKPKQIPDVREVIRLWREMASKSGLVGLHIAGVTADLYWNHAEEGFDASIVNMPRIGEIPWISKRNPVAWTQQKLNELRRLPRILTMQKLLETQTLYEGNDKLVYPCVIHAWDNTPRSAHRGVVISDSSPEFFRRALRKSMDSIKHNKQENRIVFLKSWNEWAEGNHLEPDFRYGHSYLQIVKEETGRTRTAI